MEYLTNINNDSHSQSIAKFQETQLSINPNIQDKVIEQVLLQSGGVSLGVILSIVGAIGVAKWMGIGSLFAKWMERVDSGTESLKALADALTRITGDLKPTFSMSKYTQNIFPSRLFCEKKNFIKQLKPNHNNHFMLFAI
jgi:hypothetical protein